MKKLLVSTLGLALLAVTSLHAEDVKSGLKTDDGVSAFNVNDVTGPSKGKTLCYRCQYGARPVVSIFTRKLDENVVNLIKNVDGQVEQNKDAQLKAFVVLLTDDPDAAEKQLTELAAKAGIKNVPLTTFDGKAGPPEYKINAGAETTVLMWTKSKLKVNEAFEAGKFSKDDVTKIAGATTKILE